MEVMRLELRELRESQREEERRISDESRLLYAEAFGSINLGSAKSDSEVSAVFSSNWPVSMLICLMFRSTRSVIWTQATRSWRNSWLS